MSIILEPPQGTVDRLVETLVQLSDGEPGTDVELTIGPGLPVYSLDFDAIVDWDLERAKGKFWRFVVFGQNDEPMFADMTFEAIPRFSASSHGDQAQAYLEHVSQLADQALSEEDYEEVRVLDVPTYSTLSLWLKGNQRSLFFPIKVLGRPIKFSPLEEVEFRRVFTAEVLRYRKSLSSSRQIAPATSIDTDEGNNSLSDDTTGLGADATTPASSDERAKKRKPSGSKPDFDATDVPSKKGSRIERSSARAGEATSASARKDAGTDKSPGKTSSTARSSNTASNFSEESFVDLLKLEEENRILRERLARKLSDENADLRKKLGLA